MTDSVDLTAAQGHARRRIALRLLLLAVTAIALYLVLPGLIAMFGSLPQLEAVFPAWFVPIFVLEAAAFACIWALMRIALHTDNWFDIACAQLTGNALSHALPGGAATGGATMFQMLTRAGFDGPTTSTALTAVGLLSTATLFVLPILALPAMVFGLAVRSELLQGAILGGVLGIFLLTGASILLISDRVVRKVGRLFDWFVRRVLRRPTPDPVARSASSKRVTSCAPRWRRRGSRRCPPRWGTSCSTSWPSTSACSRSVRASIRCSCCSRSWPGAHWR